MALATFQLPKSHMWLMATILKIALGPGSIFLLHKTSCGGSELGFLKRTVVSSWALKDIRQCCYRRIGSQSRTAPLGMRDR